MLGFINMISDDDLKKFIDRIESHYPVLFNDSKNREKVIDGALKEFPELKRENILNIMAVCVAREKMNKDIHVYGQMGIELEERDKIMEEWKLEEIGF